MKLKSIMMVGALLGVLTLNAGEIYSNNFSKGKTTGIKFRQKDSGGKFAVVKEGIDGKSLEYTSNSAQDCLIIPFQNTSLNEGETLSYELDFQLQSQYFNVNGLVISSIFSQSENKLGVGIRNSVNYGTNLNMPPIIITNDLQIGYCKETARKPEGEWFSFKKGEKYHLTYAITRTTDGLVLKAIISGAILKDGELGKVTFSATSTSSRFTYDALTVRINHAETQTMLIDNIKVKLEKGK